MNPRKGWASHRRNQPQMKEARQKRLHKSSRASQNPSLHLEKGEFLFQQTIVINPRITKFN